MHGIVYNLNSAGRSVSQCAKTICDQPTGKLVRFQCRRLPFPAVFFAYVPVRESHMITALGRINRLRGRFESRTLLLIFHVQSCMGFARHIKAVLANLFNPAHIFFHFSWS